MGDRGCMSRAWYPDERDRAGPEHLDPDYVAGYDAKTHLDLEDALALLRRHGLGAKTTLVDLGCGTGLLAATAASEARYRAPLDRLGQGAQLDCYSYGKIANDGLPLYGDTLGHGRYTIQSRADTRLSLAGPLLDGSDIGGACFDVARPGELAAVIVDASNVQATPSSGRLAGSRRGWVSTFLTKFELIAQHSGQCLTAPAEQVKGWPQLQQQGCRTTEDQRFRIIPILDGRLTIRAVSSERCLTVAGGSRDDGAAVIEATCSGDMGDPLDLPSSLPPEQLWTIVTAGDGRLQIFNDLSRKCLDVAGADTADGAALIQWSCHVDSTNQHWQVNAVAFGEDAHKLVAAANREECIDVFGASTATGAAIGRFPCHGGLNQQWQLAAIPPRFMAAMSAHTHFDMVMAGVSSRVVQVPWTAAEYEQWRIELRPGGYALRSRTDESLCLDIGSDGLLVERRCATIGGSGRPTVAQRWLVQ